MASVEARNSGSLPVFRTREQLRRQLTNRGWWTSVPLTTFPAHWLYQGEQRLDAGYYANEAFAALRIVQDSGFEVKSLKALGVTAYHPTQSQPRSNFKRIYVSKGYGIPFLRPSHLPQMRSYDLGYISKLTDVLDSLLLRKGDVLITTDGTVGRVAIVTNRIAGWAGSNNIARITYGNFDARNGYLAAFLSSPYGCYQLTREIYGGVVDHIEAPHIESVLIPEAPPEVQMSIGQQVVHALEKKDKATAIEEAAVQRLETILEDSAR